MNSAITTITFDLSVVNADAATPVRQAEQCVFKETNAAYVEKEYIFPTFNILWGRVGIFSKGSVQ